VIVVTDVDNLSTLYWQCTRYYLLNYNKIYLGNIYIYKETYIYINLVTLH